MNRTRSMSVIAAGAMALATLWPATDAAAEQETSQAAKEVVVAAAGDIACQPGKEPSSGASVSSARRPTW